MQNIEEFKIDVWSRAYNPRAKVVLASSYASAISINQLEGLGPELVEAGQRAINPNQALTYAPSEGTPELRSRIAAIHSGNATMTADNVVVTPGSIMANYLVLATVCGPGDHIICQYPTYGQLYLMPKYLSGDVSLWEAKEDKGWAVDVEELAALVKPNTKAIILNNPCNPTGYALSQEEYEKIIAIAKKSNLILISDEVFSPLFYETPTPPLVSLGYPRSISTGSVSKAHGLAGLRIGWVVTPDAELMERVVTMRDYTTLNVSRVDDGVALFALDPKVLPRIIEQNIAMMKESITLVDELVRRNKSRCSWTRAAGGGTAFIKIVKSDGSLIDDVDFCARLVEEEGISIIPGHHCFSEPGAGGFKGHIRITLGEPQRLRECLDTIASFIQRY